MTVSFRGGGRDGPLRLGLAALAVVGLAFFAVVLARVDGRLGDQARANRRTQQATGAIVAVNRRIADRIGQIDALTADAGVAVDATAQITPLLEQLRAATAQANSLARDGRGGAEATRASLEEVRRLVDVLGTQIASLGQSAEGVVTQQGSVSGVLDGLAADLDEALGETRRIRAVVDSLVPG